MASVLAHITMRALLAALVPPCRLALRVASKLMRRPPVTIAFVILKIASRLLPVRLPDTANNLRVGTLKLVNALRGSNDNTTEMEIFPWWWVWLVGVLVPAGLEGVRLEDGLAQMNARTIGFGAPVQDDLDSGRFSRIVYVGAGLDTKLLRHAAARDGTDVAAPELIELDLPSTIEAKRQLFARWRTGRRHVRPCSFVSVDLNETAVHEALARALPPAGGRTSYHEEATLVYIEPARRARLLRELLEGAPAGSHFHLSVFTSMQSGQESLVPLPHAGGREGAQAALDDAFGRGRYAVSAYSLFEPPGYFAALPPGYASDFHADGGAAWASTRDGVAHAYVRRAGVLSIVKR